MRTVGWMDGNLGGEEDLRRTQQKERGGWQWPKYGGKGKFRGIGGGGGREGGKGKKKKRNEWEMIMGSRRSGCNWTKALLQQQMLLLLLPPSWEKGVKNFWMKKKFG